MYTHTFRYPNSLASIAITSLVPLDDCNTCTSHRGIDIIKCCTNILLYTQYPLVFISPVLDRIFPKLK